MPKMWLQKERRKRWVHRDGGQEDILVPRKESLHVSVGVREQTQRDGQRRQLRGSTGCRREGSELGRELVLTNEKDKRDAGSIVMLLGDQRCSRGCFFPLG